MGGETLHIQVQARVLDHRDAFSHLARKIKNWIRRPSYKHTTLEADCAGQIALHIQQIQNELHHLTPHLQNRYIVLSNICVPELQSYARAVSTGETEIAFAMICNHGKHRRVKYHLYAQRLIYMVSKQRCDLNLKLGVLSLGESVLGLGALFLLG